MNLGLLEFIAQTPPEYIDLAVRLARDPQRLAELRRTLRPRLRQSALMNATQLTGNLECLYREIWRTWCALP
jgi:predicted O-linked N-acetylglucosamine transferase (SPINDLY family)